MRVVSLKILTAAADGTAYALQLATCAGLYVTMRTAGTAFRAVTKSTQVIQQYSTLRCLDRRPDSEGVSSG